MWGPFRSCGTGHRLTRRWRSWKDQRFFLYSLFIIYMEGPKVEEGSNKYIDYHYEASEYEKKLIQVSVH